MFGIGPIVNLSELKHFFVKIGRRPDRSLSQNFLIDANIAEKIIRTAEVDSGDCVLEIGPGAGALTSLLLNRGAAVAAIEKDPILSVELSRLQTPTKRLVSIHEDFLEFHLDQLCTFFGSIKPFKVVANLPYHITTPILIKLFEWRHCFSSITIMVQSEVVERIIPSTPSNALMLFVGLHAKIHSSFHVSASCFYPQPKIDSKVLRLDLYPCPLDDPISFSRLTRRAFQQKRKMLCTSLRTIYHQELVQQALQIVGANLNARPEELSLDQWRYFYRIIKKNS